MDGLLGAVRFCGLFAVEADFGIVGVLGSCFGNDASLSFGGVCGRWGGGGKGVLGESDEDAVGFVGLLGAGEDKEEEDACCC